MTDIYDNNMIMTYGDPQLWKDIAGSIKKVGILKLAQEAANDILNVFVGLDVYCFWVNHEGCTTDDIDNLIDDISNLVALEENQVFFDYGLDFDGYKELSYK